MAELTEQFTIEVADEGTESRNAAAAFLKSRRIKFKLGPGRLLIVDRDIDLSGKGLTELPDLSYVAVTGNFNCSNNKLTSLKGAPCSVGGSFDCSYNEGLDSLAGAPGLVGGNFTCTDVALTSLEACPQRFNLLESDFGVFSQWNNVPVNLRISPETMAKDATTLSGVMNVHRPLRLEPVHRVPPYTAP